MLFGAEVINVGLFCDHVSVEKGVRFASSEQMEPITQMEQNWSVSLDEERGFYIISVSC